MADLILHHFAASPFSEKVRLMLGYKQLAWKSVTVPNILPKPDVLALTGGYRRTPFLQIGADIYCDTALIAQVLERLQPTPSLYPQSHPQINPQEGGALASILAQWADDTLFWAAVTFNRGASGELPPAVFEDRKAMGFDVDWWRPADAAPAYHAYVQRLSELLREQPYLLGQQPCIADFSAYHALWLVHLREGATVQVPPQATALRGWLGRMQSIGHGRAAPLDAAQAIAIAADSQPAAAGCNLLDDGGFQDEHGLAPGSRVAISAQSFGREPTEGELVAATPQHYSLRRVDPRAGLLHVHFPRIGYVLKQL